MGRFVVALSILSSLVAAEARSEVPSYERDLLDRVSATYRTLQTFHLSGQVRVTTADGHGVFYQSSFVLAGARPGRVREEITEPTSGSLRISNGLESWTYLPSLKQYQRTPGAGPDIGDADAGGGAGIRVGMAGGILSNYRGIGLTLESAQVLRVEYLPFQGSDHECYVIEAAYQPAGEGPTKTFWIDRESFRVLKHTIRSTHAEEDRRVEQIETMVFDRVDLDRPIPDTLFAFSPPAGAKEVKSFGPERVDLTGHSAADFALPELSGKKRSLKAERGKVVMLDFWATWCGPCRRQMPAVEKLYREFRSKGLVVFAINQRESAKVAGDYVSQAAYTTTTLLDTRGEVGDLYKVAGIPTLVVIDRNGRIVAHYVGTHEEPQLREALAKAGLK